MTTKCSGLDALTGTPVEVSFERNITSVTSLPGPGADLPWLAPGWVDLQVNGFQGVDYNDPASPHAEIARSLQALFATGVTRFLPTVITGSPEGMTGALANLAAARESIAEGDAIEGFHVEGPHISPEDGPRGAHPRRWVRPPTVGEFDRMQDAARGLIRIVTLSPEWPAAPAYISDLTRRGVVASIGHTGANREQIQDAVAAGACMSTHMGNGAHSVISRHPNYIWEQLAEDRLTAGFIVDGIHIGPAFLKTALRAKGLERAFLVTDAVAPAGCSPGRYKLGEQEVDLHPDESVRLAGEQRLAGSSLRMNRGVANLMRLAGLSLSEAVRMATVNPARAARIGGRQRGFVIGERADLVLFRMDAAAITVERTYLSGQPVFTA